jgi:hypothetical protein
MITKTIDNTTATTIPIAIFSLMTQFFTFVYTLEPTKCPNYWDLVQTSSTSETFCILWYLYYISHILTWFVTTFMHLI